MDCREFRDELRRSGTGAMSERALRHEVSCPACASEARAARLLGLGSEVDAEAALSPGFEGRLAARLRAERSPRTVPARNGGLEVLVRPALALAATLTLLIGGFYLRLALPEPGGDLAMLVETDPILTSLSVADPDSIFAEPDAPPEADRP